MGKHITSNIEPESISKKDKWEKLGPKVTYLELANNIESVKVAKDAVTRDILQGNVCSVVISGGNELSIQVVSVTDAKNESHECIQLCCRVKDYQVEENNRDQLYSLQLTNEDVSKAVNRFFIVALQLGDFI